jgi:hypothetical protein
MTMTMTMTTHRVCSAVPTSRARVSRKMRKTPSRRTSRTIHVGCRSKTSHAEDPTPTDDARANGSFDTRRGFLSRVAVGVPAAVAAVASASLGVAPKALAEYGDTLYMDALQGSGKDYGKSSYIYPDFTVTKSGLQYKDMKEGTGDAVFDGGKGSTAVVDWDGYTIGYYGRPFEARNKSKGGAFTGDEKDFFRFKADDASVIPAFREAIVGMRVGSIRRIIVSPNSGLGYPEGRAWRSQKPQPANFSGDRALGFVLENQGMIDKTLLFDIELIKILD